MKPSGALGGNQLSYFILRFTYKRSVGLVECLAITGGCLSFSYARLMFHKRWLVPGFGQMGRVYERQTSGVCKGMYTCSVHEINCEQNGFEMDN